MALVVWLQQNLFNLWFNQGVVSSPPPGSTQSAKGGVIQTENCLRWIEVEKVTLNGLQNPIPTSIPDLGSVSMVKKIIKVKVKTKRTRPILKGLPLEK